MESGVVIDGRYRLRERLGHGGMSVVWRADDDLLGREVAVKVLSARLAADPDVTHRILAEARAAAGLRHATVVEVYDYGEATYRDTVLPYVVMELVEGRTMADLLSGNRIPWRLAVLICAQVAAALTAAHARGIVHRDVKPGNVMVSSSGVKLVDFGISAAIGETDGADGQLLGTPAYLAPERIDGGPVRPAADVYALGLLLYLSLAGRMPWEAATTTQMLKAHYYAEPAPLPPVPGLPAEVSRLVRRCLVKEPGERPSSAEAAEILGRVAGLPPAPPVFAVAAAGTATVPGRRRILVAAGAAAVLATGGLVAWTADFDHPPAPAAAGRQVNACPAETPHRDATAAPASSTVGGTGCRATPSTSPEASTPSQPTPPAVRQIRDAGPPVKAAPVPKAGGPGEKAEDKPKKKAKPKAKVKNKT
ncbi:serine/threonine-protein kinase [Actinoplanes flavus]|uniref:serine/threonine-protein kinase n=1 Tax=Actinoplanes flavus TaxID=2820290 RepID=UPI003557E811